MEKQECPFCKKKFVGNAPDGQSFFDKHLAVCESRKPPDRDSLPIQVRITECQKCGHKEFRFRAHADSWHPRRVLWIYACKSCGQVHTALNSLNAIADDVPYAKVQNPTKRKPPKWER